MRRLFFAMFVTFFASIGTMSLANCQGSLPAGANSAVNAGNPNMALFSAAVRYYTNVERCRRGLAPLAGDANLLRAAMAHSNNMARSNNMSHTLNIAGQRTMVDRMRSFGVSYRTAAENIAQEFLLLMNGRPFIPSSNSCQLVYADTRQPIPQHSYNSLAQSVVARWMASSGHRNNILNSRMTRMEASANFVRTRDTCGLFFITQNFAG